MGVCGHLIHLLRKCCQPDSFGKRKRAPVLSFLSGVWRLRSGLGCSPEAGEATWSGLARSLGCCDQVPAADPQHPPWCRACVADCPSEQMPTSGFLP